jgi:N-acetyl-anhydromuramyl-L-alanine amidase AmpD
MRNWRYIVWHTAADPRDRGKFDTSAEEIDAWHKANGWSGIGYHFVIRKTGMIERGRSTDEIGAHVRGLNHQAIGICFSGHGDLEPLTEAQQLTGIRLTKILMKRYNIPVENVIGHREVNLLIQKKQLDKAFWVRKTCPGKLVDMDKIREQISRTGIGGTKDGNG